MATDFIHIYIHHKHFDSRPELSLHDLPALGVMSFLFLARLPSHHTTHSYIRTHFSFPRCAPFCSTSRLATIFWFHRALSTWER